MKNHWSFIVRKPYCLFTFLGLSIARFQCDGKDGARDYWVSVSLLGYEFTILVERYA